MSLTVPHLLPRIVERSVNTTLTLEVRAADGTVQTASAATVTIQDGAAVLVSQAVASVGPPASYALSGSVTQGRNLSDAWLEVWALTISGTPYTFRRAGYLVRHAFYPTITDTDLTDRDSDLLTLMPPTLSSLEKYREQARTRIERDLLRKGRRPWLIFDSYDLCDAHIALALARFYWDCHLKVSDGRYGEMAAKLEREYTDEMGRVSFRYDEAESGDVDDPSPTAGQGPLILSAAPRGRSHRWRW